MYAVIETGGKQYRVEVGTELEVELLDAEPGTEITLDRVLLVADGDTAAIGRPTVANASVHAEVVRRDRGPKLISFKYRPKARSRVKKGHRQDLLVLRIADIMLDGKSAAEGVAKKADAKKLERAQLVEAAARQAAEDAALAATLAEKAAEVSAPVAAAPKKSRAAKPAIEAPVAEAVEAAPEEAVEVVESDAAPADAAPAEAVEADAAPKRGRTKKDA
jgi:large subunit ribosomal protein L21